MAELPAQVLADLRAAFITESMNVQRYAYFAEVAEIEGHPELAQLLRELADSTACVAHGHFDFLHFATDPATDRLVGDTRSQLGAVVTNESQEGAELYPRFRRRALDQGCADVASWMETVRALKSAHVSKVEQALTAQDEHSGLVR